MAQLTMNEHETNTGAELLFLLRQQRYLYHQLRILTDRQCQLAGTDSSELLVEIFSGRSKLIEKLQELDNKLRPIKAGWQEFSNRIGAEYKTAVYEIVSQIQEIINKIMAFSPTEMVQNLPLHQDWEFEEIYAGIEH